MDLTDYKNNKPILEKIMLAYWYSIPGDNPSTPDQIKIIQDNINHYTVEIYKNTNMYGIACIQKKEIDKYLEKIKELKEHELDIINRIDKELIN